MPDKQELTIEDEVIQDFFDEFDEHYSIITTFIEATGNSFEDPSSIDNLFRSVHSIKSLMRMLSLEDLAQLVHHLENILDQIRRNAFKFDLDCGDVLRLTLDEIRIAAEKILSGQPTPKELAYIANAIERIYTTDKEARQEAIQVALTLLNPFAVEYAQPEFPEIVYEEMDYAHLSQDISFFEEIASSIRHRLTLSDNYHDIIFNIAKAMIQFSKKPLSIYQIKAAILLNAWGLALMPLSITKMEGTLSDEQCKSIEQHLKNSARLLDLMPHWSRAAMIIQQSHERPDGQGYPKRLTNDNICDEAKILSIAQSFVAMIQSRPYHKKTTRTYVAAIMEINKEAGRQFDIYWSDVFNSVVKKLYQEHKL